MKWSEKDQTSLVFEFVVLKQLRNFKNQIINKQIIKIMLSSMKTQHLLRLSSLKVIKVKLTKKEYERVTFSEQNIIKIKEISYQNEKVCFILTGIQLSDKINF